MNLSFTVHVTEKQKFMKICKLNSVIYSFFLMSYTCHLKSPRVNEFWSSVKLVFNSNDIWSLKWTVWIHLIGSLRLGTFNWIYSFGSQSVNPFTAVIKAVFLIYIKLFFWFSTYFLIFVCHFLCSEVAPETKKEWPYLLTSHYSCHIVHWCQSPLSTTGPRDLSVVSPDHFMCPGPAVIRLNQGIRSWTWLWIGASDFGVLIMTI